MPHCEPKLSVEHIISVLKCICKYILYIWRIWFFREGWKGPSMPLKYTLSSMQHKCIFVYKFWSSSWKTSLPSRKGKKISTQSKVLKTVFLAFQKSWQGLWCFQPLISIRFPNLSWFKYERGDVYRKTLWEECEPHAQRLFLQLHKLEQYLKAAPQLRVLSIITRL